MRGNKKVIDELNAALSAELTAIVQYMVQAEMCDNWGYKRLAEITKKRAFTEMRHAEAAIERILFLDGSPAVDVALKPQIGKDVETQLKTDLRDEHDAIKQYNEAIQVCTEAGDDGSREQFEQMIHDEEEHADWLESQLELISQVGIQNYLSQQLYEEK